MYYVIVLSGLSVSQLVKNVFFVMSLYSIGILFVQIVYRTALSFDPWTTEHGGQSIMSDLNVSICTNCVLSDRKDLNIDSSAPCIL